MHACTHRIHTHMHTHARPAALGKDTAAFWVVCIEGPLFSGWGGCPRPSFPKKSGSLKGCGLRPLFYSCQELGFPQVAPRLGWNIQGVMWKDAEEGRKGRLIRAPQGGMVELLKGPRLPLPTEPNPPPHSQNNLLSASRPRELLPSRVESWKGEELPAMTPSGVPGPRSPVIWLRPPSPPSGRALFHPHPRIISASHLILSSWFHRRGGLSLPGGSWGGCGEYQFWEVIVRTVTMATSITSAEPKVLHVGLIFPRKDTAFPVPLTSRNRCHCHHLSQARPSAWKSRLWFPRTGGP